MIADEVDVESEVLHQLPVSKLHERFVSVYGEAPRSRNRIWLIRKILWWLQSLKGGSLSERARQRATELAADADVRLMPAHRSPAVSVKPAEKRQRTEPSVDRRLPANRTPIYRDYKGKRVKGEVMGRALLQSIDFIFLPQSFCQTRCLVFGNLYIRPVK